MRFLFQDPSLDATERLLLGSSYVVRLFLAGALVVALWQGAWPTGFATGGIFILTLAPLLIRNQARRWTIPVEFDLLAVLFIFASLYLGTVRAYYDRFWWWDLVLHSGSGLLMALLGFVLVYVLNTHQRARLSLSAAFVALFAFAFAMTIGVLWEILEFSFDRLLGFHMQLDSLVDTMWDLIVNTAGALLVSVAGYRYIRGGHPLLLERAVRRILKRREDRRAERG